MVKSKHVPTTTRLATLLLKLMDYTFDLKYLEGNKLKVSDALSRLYIEEKHKVSDVIPLNFLLHFSDRQLFQDYDKVLVMIIINTLIRSKHQHPEHDTHAKHVIRISRDIKQASSRWLIRM